MSPISDEKPALAMPRAIQLFQKCVEHKIQDCVIQRLHFNDLYVLLLSLDISDIKQAIRNHKQIASKKKGVKYRDVNGNDAIKFLKGGG